MTNHPPCTRFLIRDGGRSAVKKLAPTCNIRPGQEASEFYWEEPVDPVHNHYEFTPDMAALVLKIICTIANGSGFGDGLYQLDQATAEIGAGTIIIVAPTLEGLRGIHVEIAAGRLEARTLCTAIG